MRRATLAPILTFALLAACGSDGPDYETIETLTLGRQTLLVEVAEGERDDAPGLVRVRRRDVEGGVIYEGTVANGGEPVGIDNIRPDASRPDYLWLCLNGAGQGDLAVSINLGNGLVVEDPRPCRD